MTGFGLPDRFQRQGFRGQNVVQLSCRAVVAGEEVQVSMVVAQLAYDDPEARKLIEKQIRFGLMEKILEKWTPVVTVRR